MKIAFAEEHFEIMSKECNEKEESNDECNNNNLGANDNDNCNEKAAIVEDVISKDNTSE